MPRLSFALTSVLAHVAAQETRITDPAVAASAENGRLYELMKAEYFAEACEDAGSADSPRRRLLDGRLRGRRSLRYLSGRRLQRLCWGLVRLSVLSLGSHRREQYRGGIVPRQTFRVLPSPARRPCMSKRLLYAPLVPFPRRDRRLNGSRPVPVSPVLCLMMYRKY